MSEDNQNENIEFQSFTNTNQENNISIKKSSYMKMLKGIIAAIAIATFLGGYAVGTLNDNSDSISAEELQQIISEIEAKIPAPQPTQAPSQPSAPSVIQVSLDDDPFKGNPDAPVTVVEFSDFQCPFCSRFFTQTLPALQENYIDTGKIKLVYKDLPLDNLHPNARPAHIAAECADEQGKFWEYHDVLFEKQSEWNRLSSADLSSQLNQYATSMGLESASFDSCLSSQSMADEVNADFLQATQYGATGTPTFFIGNEKDGFIKLVGAQPYAAFQAAIDNQLG
ncbi:MAG: DsbA family protein [Nitrosopumilaceae archaeon]